MKKLFVILVCTLLGIKSIAQAQDEQITAGNVRYDGFKNITKGALWSKRPEAKLVYNGSYPPDVEVIDLKEDYYVRFVDGEHNSLDRNYIIFPKGEKIYKKNGKYYAAICGNEIEFLRPVNMVKIVEVPKHDTVRIEKHDTVNTAPKKLLAAPPLPVMQPQPVGDGWVNRPTSNGWDNRMAQAPPKKEGVKLHLSFFFNGRGGYGGYIPPSYPTYDPRTMPPGIGTGNNNGNGGVNADPRTMPPGQGNGRVWIPGYYDQNGNWIPGHWQ